jgi:hypothetical protein
MVARDQLVGPWQVPVADCAISTSDYKLLENFFVAKTDSTHFWNYRFERFLFEVQYTRFHHGPGFPNT